MESRAKVSPLGRLCTPSDVAPVVAFLASDISTFYANRKYSLITANLLTHIIVPNIHSMKNLLSDDGTMIISGVGDQKKNLAEDAFRQAQLQTVQYINAEGWNGYLLRKK